MRAAALFTLLDGDAQHKRHPATFHMPAMADRAALMPGARAKLVFQTEPMSERMWVTVQERLPGARYAGTLANTPVSIAGLSHGARVEFAACHVIEVASE
jgi:hypothetical protein